MSVENDNESKVESKPKLSLRRETVRHLRVRSGVRTGDCGGENSLICEEDPKASATIIRPPGHHDPI